MREFGWKIEYTLSLSFPVFLELFGLIRRVRYDAAIDEFYLPYAAAKAGGRSAKRLFKGVGDVMIPEEGIADGEPSLEQVQRASRKLEQIIAERQERLRQAAGRA